MTVASRVIGPRVIEVGFRGRLTRREMDFESQRDAGSRIGQVPDQDSCILLSNLSGLKRVGRRIKVGVALLREIGLGQILQVRQVDMTRAIDIPRQIDSQLEITRSLPSTRDADGHWP